MDFTLDNNKPTQLLFGMHNKYVVPFVTSYCLFHDNQHHFNCQISSSFLNFILVIQWIGDSNVV